MFTILSAGSDFGTALSGRTTFFGFDLPADLRTCASAWLGITDRTARAIPSSVVRSRR